MRAFCVGGAALGDMYVHSAWQAWHLWHWAGSGGAVGSQRGRRRCLRGRGGTWRHVRAFCVADEALGDMYVHSAWQAWHLWHWAGSGGALGSQLTPWTPPVFAWQAWYLATRACILRGRCGTWWHGPPLCVAGVALIMALGWLWWRAWFPVDAVDAAAVCVAGVALGDMDSHFAWQAWHLATMDLHFAWQAWHLWHWAGSGGALGSQLTL